MTNALELLKASATTGHVGGRNPLEIFYDKIRTQIEYAGQIKEGKDINTRSLWFRRDGAGYVVRIGRNAFEIAGSKLFRAADLDKVAEILTAAKTTIEQDKKLQDTIALHSLERSERLKKGRAKKK
ncbi:hypothetical protein O9X80_11140 [Agrobacterium salinitolerans]|uniref:hypothetical protein n=1 Tax=Agrobacterium salinitolerans TaxID=1183413 RepID=UPI0022B80D79|nr:hypothetical protein [Agrobacterium salinitolerans]MCZ7975042.1 hypothetical protein [Agrobacterium salinitolerans]